MAFTVNDFQDLLKVLDQHPEWRDELRRRLLTDELLELPAIVRELAERMDALAGRMDALAGQMDELAKAQAGTEHQLGALVGRVGMLEGSLFEMKFAERSPAYLSRFARRLRRIDASRLADMLDDAADEGRITSAERDDVLLADVVLSGRRREDDAEAYYVVEVSAGVRPDDVARARRRADVMAKLGRPATPIVVGERISSRAAAQADQSGVARLVEPSIWPGAGLDLD